MLALFGARGALFGDPVTSVTGRDLKWFTKAGSAALQAAPPGVKVPPLAIRNV